MRSQTMRTQMMRMTRTMSLPCLGSVGTWQGPILPAKATPASGRSRTRQSRRLLHPASPVTLSLAPSFLALTTSSSTSPPLLLPMPAVPTPFLGPPWRASTPLHLVSLHHPSQLPSPPRFSPPPVCPAPTGASVGRQVTCDRPPSIASAQSSTSAAYMNKCVIS